MERACDVCGVAYVAKRAASRYCGERCRKRAQRTGKVTPLKQAAKPRGKRAPAEPVAGGVEPAAAGPGAVEAATLEILEAAGRLSTPLGQAALVLARRLDRPGLDTGSAIAGVARQLEATLTAALRGSGAAAGPQKLRDELAERRRKHGA